MFKLATIVLHLVSAAALDWERVAFPASDFFSRLRNESCYRSDAARVECIAVLDALARAASAGHEFLVMSKQLDESVEVVTFQDLPVFQEAELSLVRDSKMGLERMARLPKESPEESRARRHDPDLLARTIGRAKNIPRLDFESARDRLLTRSPLYRREIAANALILLERRRDPFVRLYLPPTPATESRLTFMLKPEHGRYVFDSIRPNSNLDRAGVGPGDVLLEIQGQSLSTVTPVEALRQLPPSENVRLSILNVAGEREEIEVPRKERDLQIVSSAAMTVNRVPIGVLRIQTFADSRTCEFVYEHLRSLRNKGVRALIYDLRDNPGGFVPQAQCTLGLHLGRARYLWRQRLLEDAPGYPQVRKYSKVVDLFTKRRRVLEELPTAVLINANSASATELAAASLREHEAAWLVGTRTFGKGVAQVVLPLIDGYPDVLVWKTIASTEHASGHSVQGRGVDPDFKVKSVLGGAHDLDDDEAQRFTDVNGTAFAESRSDYRRSVPRAEAHGRVNRCVRRQRLTPDTSITARWLRDRQLRAAVAVALCAK